MTGQTNYAALLTSQYNSNTSGALYFKCEGEASLLLSVQGDDFSDKDHLSFDAKVGDGAVFQVFGLKLGTDQLGTAFQLDEDALEDMVRDGVPIYLRYTIGNRVSTVSFVPNGSERALAPVKQCKHG